MFTEQESRIKIGISREKSMCFRLKRKENRPRRNRCLILQLSSDDGVPGAPDGWLLGKGWVGAPWGCCWGVVGPTGRTPGWGRGPWETH